MSYNPTNWVTGDVITAQKLNKMEQGIEDASVVYVNMNIDLVQDEVDVYEITEVDKTAEETYAILQSGKNVIINATVIPWDATYVCYVVQNFVGNIEYGSRNYLFQNYTSWNSDREVGGETITIWLNFHTDESIVCEWELEGVTIEHAPILPTRPYVDGSYNLTVAYGAPHWTPVSGGGLVVEVAYHYDVDTQTNVVDTVSQTAVDIKAALAAGENVLVVDQDGTVYLPRYITIQDGVCIYFQCMTMEFSATETGVKVNLVLFSVEEDDTFSMDIEHYPEEE